MQDAVDRRKGARDQRVQHARRRSGQRDVRVDRRVRGHAGAAAVAGRQFAVCQVERRRAAARARVEGRVLAAEVAPGRDAEAGAGRCRTAVDAVAARDVALVGAGFSLCGAAVVEDAGDDGLGDGLDTGDAVGRR